MLRINVNETTRGLVFKHGRKRYPLDWPAGVWKKCPKAFREVLADHLAHLLTMDVPLVAPAEGVTLNRTRPAFWQLFRTLALGSIPQAVEVYPPSTAEVLERFRRTRYVFANDLPEPPPRSSRRMRPRAVVLFSAGKDSLASLGLARELGLDPIPVYIDDTVSPSENRIKKAHLRKLAAMGMKPQLVTNRVEQLNDFETWTGDESCLGYMHMVTGFALIALPVAVAHRAQYIVLGNQQNMNFGFLNKDGYWTWPSFDQTLYWMKQQDAMVRVLSGGATGVVSVIEPLTNIAIMRVLFHEYPEIAKYLVSCDSLDASDEPRWCHNCNKCARLQLLIRAAGADPARVGFHHDLLELRHKRLYRLFDGRNVDHYEQSAEARDEQLLAFFMAWQNGTSGPLMVQFERDLLAEAMEREDELQRRFFTFYRPGSIPDRLRRRVLTFYEREFLT